MKFTGKLFQVHYDKLAKFAITAIEMYNTHISFDLTSLCSQICPCKCDEIGVSARRKALGESRNVRARGSSTFSRSLFPVAFTLSSRCGRWEFSRGPLRKEERERMIAMVDVRGWGGGNRCVRGGEGEKRNADWKSAAAPQRRVHQQENWGWARIIRTTGDEGMGEEGNLFPPFAPEIC